ARCLGHPGVGLTGHGRRIHCAGGPRRQRLWSGERALVVVHRLEVETELADDRGHFGAMAAGGDPLVSRYGDAREDADEADDDHQLDHRESAMRADIPFHARIVCRGSQGAQHPCPPTRAYFFRVGRRSAGTIAPAPNFSSMASRERLSRSRFFRSASKRPSCGAAVLKSAAWTPVRRTGCASTLPRRCTATRKISAESSVGRASVSWRVTTWKSAYLILRCTDRARIPALRSRAPTRSACSWMKGSRSSPSRSSSNVSSAPMLFASASGSTARASMPLARSCS